MNILLSFVFFVTVTATTNDCETGLAKCTDAFKNTVLYQAAWMLYATFTVADVVNEYTKENSNGGDNAAGSISPLTSTILASFSLALMASGKLYM